MITLTVLARALRAAADVFDQAAAAPQAAPQQPPMPQQALSPAPMQQARPRAYGGGQRAPKPAFPVNGKGKTCEVCGGGIAHGDMAMWGRERGAMVHVQCGQA